MTYNRLARARLIAATVGFIGSLVYAILSQAEPKLAILYTICLLIWCAVTVFGVFTIGHRKVRQDEMSDAHERIADHWAYRVAQLIFMGGVLATAGFGMEISLSPALLFSASFLLYMLQGAGYLLLEGRGAKSDAGIED
jgi:uncharacterized membrane protein